MSSQAEQKLKVLGPVLVVFSVIASIYIGTVNNVKPSTAPPFPALLFSFCFLSCFILSRSLTRSQGWKWFSWHPTAMIFAYVGMCGNAALIKKVGGKTNTEIHGYVMTLAALLASFGW